MKELNAADLIALDDGAVGLVFPDHPAHHRDGRITVTWCKHTLTKMIEAQKIALETGSSVTIHQFYCPLEDE